jgi:hypothetical protein
MLRGSDPPNIFKIYYNERRIEYERETDELIM